MTRRRPFAASTPLLAASALWLSGCSADPASAAYDAVADRTWQPVAAMGLAGAALGRELVRCATLGPSSHNTQRWKLVLERTRAQTTPLFTTIPLRPCPRGDDDGEALSSEESALRQRAGSSDTVCLLLLTDCRALKQRLDCVIPGNTAQLAAKRENEKHARQVCSSAGIAVVVGQTADHAHRVEVGRSYERGEALPRSLRRPVQAVLA